MILKCVAIDDELLALKVIRNFASRCSAINLVETFSDAVTGAEFLRNNPVDLVFLDIKMGDISGLDLAHSLQEKPIIIFTTAHKNYAFEGYELEAIDFLLKPFSYVRFSKAVEKALEIYTLRQMQYLPNQQSLIVFSEYQKLKIPLADIEYIASSEKYATIYLAKAKPIQSLITLSKVLEKLPKDKFKRIHRSYIVPVAKIKTISNSMVVFNSGIKLPVGKTYQDFIEEWPHL